MVILNNFYFLSPQEFLAVKEGIKPVMRISLALKDNEIINNIKNLCGKYKLHFLIKSFTSIHGRKFDNMIYISRFKELARQTYEAEKNRDIKKLGGLLGYPECCVNFYNDVIYPKEARNLKFSYIIQSFLRTKGRPSFYTNNIFNLQSRRGSDILIRHQDVFENLTNYFLISHIPCSYSCKESIKLGKQILRILKKGTPEFANEIILVLKESFLFFDDFNWIVFDGEVRNNEIIYKKILPFRSLYPENKLRMLREGNKIKVSDEKIIIFKDDKILHTIEKESKYQGIIIDFS